MADPPDWAARWLERESRVIDAVERSTPLGRLPRAWLIGLLHAIGLVALLALGVAANSVLAWAMVAIPMTVIVSLSLAGWEGFHRESAAPAERAAPFDVERSVVEPSFDSPILVRRGQRGRVPESLVGRARR